MKYEFTIPGKPQAKQRARVTKKGFSYTPKETVNYENWVKINFFQQIEERRMTYAPLKIEITYFHQIPKSVSKKNRLKMLKREKYPTVKPDLDNITKSICDALNGVAYGDDAQIVILNSCKLYDDSPRVRVAITEIYCPVDEKRRESIIDRKLREMKNEI